MKDLDTAMLVEAAGSYLRLRRYYWRFFLGMPALLVVLGTPTFAFEKELNSIVRGIALALIGVGWYACWLGALFTWLRLGRFRCPRCENRFMVTWWIRWPTDCCMHCGLNLRLAALAKSKPLAVADPLE